ncbi:hypothetical protein BDD12DRAFT_891747 [Trichophaea hybrida]|nr:hypothetical protein BDD12DRAFT_891747 [Trichophaea hybrida]
MKMNLGVLSLLILLFVTSGLVQASSSPPTSTTASNPYPPVGTTASKAGVQPDLLDKIRLLRATNTKNIFKPKDHIKRSKDETEMFVIARRNKLRWKVLEGLTLNLVEEGATSNEIYRAVAGKQDWQDIIRESAWHDLTMNEKEEKFEVAMSLYNLMVTYEAIEGELA